MPELVDIVLEDATPPHDPINGVTVFVYDAAGAALITSGSTNPSGLVQFMLDGATPTPTRYQLRTFKTGISSPQPLYIDVFSPPGDAPTGANRFRIRANVFTLPQAINPKLCRLSCYFKGLDGRPLPAVDVHFIGRFSPLVVDGEGVFGERRVARSDKDGYFQIDLWRKGCYRAVIQGHENVGRSIYIPDLPAANAMYVMFPRVSAVTFDPPGPWSLGVGQELQLMTNVELTSGHVIEGTAPEDVSYTISGEQGSVIVLEDRVVLRGAVPGISTLRVQRVDNTLAYDPDTEITGDGITFTVV